MSLRRAHLPRAFSFWSLAFLLLAFLAAASAPSPLYPVYQRMWHFSSITLTAIYAVYALGGLVTLLSTGRLSDHLGRRVVLMVALGLQVIGMLGLVAANGVAGLYGGRLLQGVATGLAIGVISAWLLDLQPPDDLRLGGLVGGIALLAGLGAGALGAGVLVEFGPDPLHLVFWLLAGVFALAFIILPAVPDVVERRPGWLRSTRPEIGVPPPARTMFVATAPSIIATWSLAGFYLALGPSLAISVLHTDSRIAGGLVIAALMGVAALASALAREADPRLTVIRGSLVLILGVGITLVGVAMDSALGLYLGSVVAGLGFGPAFAATLRSLTPLAPPDKRGALLAAIYIVVFPSFSVPAIIAGVATSRYGLHDTALGAGLVVMALATATTIAVSRRKPPAATRPV